MLFISAILFQIPLYHCALSETESNFQDKLMRCFFADAFEPFLIRRAKGSFMFRDTCLYKVCGSASTPAWNEMTCEGSMLTGVDFTYSTPGKLHIAFLPPTLRNLSLESCSQCYAVDTSRLPRDIINCNLSRNRLHGSVNLQRLPNKIETFNMRSNQISGTVDIFCLPKSLISLSLAENILEQPVLYYGDLPARLVDVLLWKSGVAKVRPLSAAHKTGGKHVTFHL